MKNLRVGVGVVVAIAAVVGIAGCSATPDPAPSTNGIDATFEPELDPVLDLSDSEGARADLSDFVCGATDGTWAASGTVTNATDDDLVYVVNLGVIENESRSSLVRKNVVLDVPAGEAVTFEEASLVTDVDAIGHDCVVRVNRGTAVVEG